MNSNDTQNDKQAEQQASPDMITEGTGSTAAAVRALLDTRMLKILLIGMISGFPWVLIASMMSLWLKHEGVSRSGIGFFGIVFVVYAFNLLWAPVVDSQKIPVLHRLGQRRSWIVLMQSCIAVLILLMSLMSPAEDIWLMSLLAFLIALSSATQDVAVDALRIELIGLDEPAKVGAGSAMATSGWWLGFGGLGAVGLGLAEYLDSSMGIANFWPITYALMVVFVVVTTVLVLVFIKEPSDTERLAQQHEDAGKLEQSLELIPPQPLAFLARRGVMLAIAVGGLLLSLLLFQYQSGMISGKLLPPLGDENIDPGVFGNGWVRFFLLWVELTLEFAIVIGILAFVARQSISRGETARHAVARIYSIWYSPVSAFVRRYGVRVGLMIIAMVFLFKIGEAFLGRMSIVFYKEIGFSKGDIALYSKGFGTLALCTFAVLSSIVNARYGLFRGLLIGGIAMASTNLLFAILAYHPTEGMFAFAVVADQFTTAMSTVALVAFLSQLCDRAYTATQYAALASLGNFSRTTLAVGSGVLVDSLGGNWPIFFVITTIMVIPSLLMLLYMRGMLAGVFSKATTKVY